MVAQVRGQVGAAGLDQFEIQWWHAAEELLTCADRERRDVQPQLVDEPGGQVRERRAGRSPRLPAVSGAGPPAPRATGPRRARRGGRQRPQQDLLQNQHRPPLNEPVMQVLVSIAWKVGHGDRGGKHPEIVGGRSATDRSPPLGLSARLDSSNFRLRSSADAAARAWRSMSTAAPAARQPATSSSQLGPCHRLSATPTTANTTPPATSHGDSVDARFLPLPA
jgi:hypothetical protein